MTAAVGVGDLGCVAAWVKNRSPKQACLGKLGSQHLWLSHWWRSAFVYGSPFFVKKVLVGCGTL
jgi:hypothetical protein